MPVNTVFFCEHTVSGLDGCVAHPARRVQVSTADIVLFIEVSQWLFSSLFHKIKLVQDTIFRLEYRATKLKNSR